MKKPETSDDGALESIDDRPVAPTLDDPDVALNEQAFYSSGYRREQLRTQKLANDLTAVNVEQAKQNTGQRKHYAEQLFFLLCVWLGFIAWVIMQHGYAVGSL